VLKTILLAQDLRIALRQFFPQPNVLAVYRQSLLLLLDSQLLFLL